MCGTSDLYSPRRREGISGLNRKEIRLTTRKGQLRSTNIAMFLAFACKPYVFVHNTSVGVVKDFLKAFHEVLDYFGTKKRKILDS